MEFKYYTKIIVQLENSFSFSFYISLNLYISNIKTIIGTIEKCMQCMNVTYVFINFKLSDHSIMAM